jgi:hypothetical protein
LTLDQRRVFSVELVEQRSHTNLESIASAKKRMMRRQEEKEEEEEEQRRRHVDMRPTSVAVTYTRVET